MVEHYRHHHAANPAVILIPVPVGGSPKNARDVKPRYPKQQQLEHWTGPPKRRGKAEVLHEFMRRVVERKKAEVGRMLRPNASLLRHWMNRTA